MALWLIDWVVIVLYAVVVGAVGFYLIKNPETSEDYFLAGRKVRWPFIGASMLVSNISTEHLIGLSGMAFAFGWAVAAWELVAIYCMIPLVVLFLPLYLKTRVFTIPEFLEKRFSPGSRLAYSVYMIVWNVFTKISISLLAAGIAFEEMMGWNRWVVIMIIGLAVALYTMKGGLSAVIYTDFIQTSVLLVAGVILAILGIQAIGGLQGLRAGLPTDKLSLRRLAEGRYITERLKAGLPIDQEGLSEIEKRKKDDLGIIRLTDRSGRTRDNLDLSAAKTLQDVINIINRAGVGIKASVNETGRGILLIDTTGALGKLVVANGDETRTAELLCITNNDQRSSVDGGALSLENMRNMTKPMDHPELPWLGFWIGILLVGGVNWSTDQVLVQRVLAGKNLSEGRKGVVFCQFLKLLTPLILIFPGLLAYILYRDVIERPDHAFPVVLKNLMPHGLLGLAVAGMVAALMGHLSSTFNSNATMVSRDLYLKWRPDASQESQIAIGRGAVLLSFLLGIAWVPVIERFEFIWSYLMRIGVYLLMPYTVVFLCGVLWKRTNTAGAWSAVIVGLTLAPIMTIDSKLHFLPIISDYAVLRPYLNSSLLSLVACLIALVLGTLLCSPPPQEKLLNTTVSFGEWLKEMHRTKDQLQVSFIEDYRSWFILVIVIVTTIFVVMR